MSRTNLGKARRIQTRNPNVGKIVVFCEGDLEELYFKRLRDSAQCSKYDRVLVVKNAKGNAQSVLDYAQSKFENEAFAKKHRDAAVYLVFDCDVSDICKTLDATKKADYFPIPSKPCFELWIYLHFDARPPTSSKKLIEKLSKLLGFEYQKDAQTYNKTIDKVFEKPSNRTDACKRSEKICACFENQGNVLYNDIENVSIFTNVHEIVNLFTE